MGKREASAGKPGASKPNRAGKPGGNKPNMGDLAESMFKALDKDADGKLSATEMEAVIEKVAQEAKSRGKACCRRRTASARTGRAAACARAGRTAARARAADRLHWLRGPRPGQRRACRPGGGGQVLQGDGGRARQRRAMTWERHGPCWADAQVLVEWF